MKTRYYVCCLGYNEYDCVIDYDQDFGDFDTYDEAYELFVKLQCADAEMFFEKAPEVYQVLLQLEVCEETEDAINCVDVRNEWWIVNPKFKEEI